MSSQLSLKKLYLFALAAGGLSGALSAVASELILRNIARTRELDRMSKPITDSDSPREAAREDGHQGLHGHKS